MLHSVRVSASLVHPIWTPNTSSALDISRHPTATQLKASSHLGLKVMMEELHGIDGTFMWNEKGAFIIN